MNRWWLALVFLLAAGKFNTYAQQGASQETAIEQRRLDGMREVLNRQQQEEESDCRQRFAVNDCLKSVQTRYRAKLADIRKQEAGLHDLQRQQRADAQIREADERLRARDVRLQEQSATPERPSRGARPQNNAPASATAAEVPTRAPQSAMKVPSPEVREVHARRLRDAEERRAARDQRVKEKAAGKQPVPLPALP